MQQHTQSDAAAEKLVIALDFPSVHLALDCIDRLDGACRWVKVGLQLYCASGNRFIETLLGRNLKVFLDLKLHDIPNTVAGAVKAISGLGVSLLTIHGLGGEAMLRAAAEAIAQSPGGPKLLAATVLTSMDSSQMRGIGLVESPSDQVLRLARLAAHCGVDGLVCSAEEITLLRQEMGSLPTLVVPGVRPAGTEVGDQRRIATPLEAVKRGASMLVVGRPVTQARDPGAVLRSLLTEIGSVGSGG